MTLPTMSQRREKCEEGAETTPKYAAAPLVPLLQADSLLSESPGKTLQRGEGGQFGAQAEREMESSVCSPDVQCGRPNKVIIYKQGQFLGNFPRVTHNWYIF